MRAMLVDGAHYVRGIRQEAGEMTLERAAACPKCGRVLGWPTAGRVLFTLRRLTPRMGIENLIEAMAAVRAAAPDVSLVIGGDGPLRGICTTFTTTLGIGICRWRRITAGRAASTMPSSEPGTRISGNCAA